MNCAVSETLKCPLKELRGGWPAEKPVPCAVVDH